MADFNARSAASLTSASSNLRLSNFTNDAFRFDKDVKVRVHIRSPQELGNAIYAMLPGIKYD